MSVTRSPLERLARPEYTGGNRCTPCTVVNLVFAVGLALAAGRVRSLLALPTLVAATVVIYLRGYLVPGTPALTRRYLPDRVLAAFDKRPNEPATEVPEEMRRIAASRAQNGEVTVDE